jgi:hypothetical protein
MNYIIIELKTFFALKLLDNSLSLQTRGEALLKLMRVRILFL